MGWVAASPPAGTWAPQSASAATILTTIAGQTITASDGTSITLAGNYANTSPWGVVSATPATWVRQ